MVRDQEQDVQANVDAVVPQVDTGLAPSSLLSLSDELLVQILCYLRDPKDCSALSVTCRRLYNISKDPWTRSTYFIRYGKIRSLNFAIERGRLLDPRALDIMLSSGAHMSRYLLQCVIGHFTRGAPIKWIRSNWSRSLSYSTFSRFVTIGAEKYGDQVDVSKGSDDASVIEAFVSRKKRASVKDEAHWLWEAREWIKIQEIFEKYGFIPFDDRDPAMSKLPVWISTEPRILPLARRNGFCIDPSYRDSIFRKLFECTLDNFGNPINNSADIVQNVKELSRIDPDMFLSRTVGAEICMDCVNHPTAYDALKTLDRFGVLRFDLATLVGDILRLYRKAHVLTKPEVATLIHALYKDFPSPRDDIIRSVMILSVFTQHKVVSAFDSRIPFSYSHSEKKQISEARTKLCKRITTQLTTFGLFPLTKLDIMLALESPVTLSEAPIFKYAQRNQKKLGLTEDDMCAIAENVVLTSLTCSHKGKVVRELFKFYPDMQGAVRSSIAKYSLDLEDLTDLDADSGLRQLAPLNRIPSLSSSGILYESVTGEPELGSISTRTLSAAIIQDQAGIRGSRTRFWLELGAYHVTRDTVSVGEWVLSTFGALSREAAIFLTHAMINGNDLEYHNSIKTHGVPVTLKHFKIRLKMGLEMRPSAWEAIRSQPFYGTEDDYILQECRFRYDTSIPPITRTLRTKHRPANHAPIETSAAAGTSTRINPTNGVASRKRPRRLAAAAVKSYALEVSSSDEEEEEAEFEFEPSPFPVSAKKRKFKDQKLRALKTEGLTLEEREEAGREAKELSLWVEHLSQLLAEENQKFKERKQGVERDQNGRLKSRTWKTSGHVDLIKRLAELRGYEQLRRLRAVPFGVIDDDVYNMGGGSDSDDDEDYHYHGDGRRRADQRRKRRRTATIIPAASEDAAATTPAVHGYPTDSGDSDDGNDSGIGGGDDGGGGAGSGNSNDEFSDG